MLAPEDLTNLIVQSAQRYGIDPATALRVAHSEGFSTYVGDQGTSFGPFQLHYGGRVAGGNSVGGLGDEFTRVTGLDASNPNTVPQQIDFAMQHASQNGWGAWHGAQRVGIGNFDGIGGNPAANSSQPPQASSGPVQLPSVQAASVVPGGGQNASPTPVSGNPGGTPQANPVQAAIGNLFRLQNQQQAQQAQLAQNQIKAGQPQPQAINPFAAFEPAQVQPVAGTPETNKQAPSINPFAAFENQPTQQPQAFGPNSALPAQGQLPDYYGKPYLGGMTQAELDQRAAQLPYGLGTAAGFVAGFGKGVGDTVLGAEQLVGKGLQALGADQTGSAIANAAGQDLRKNAAIAAPFQQASPFATGLGQFTGTVASAAPLAEIAAPTAATGMLGAAGRGAVAGGLGSLATPVNPNSQDYWTEKGWQTGLGTIGGAVLGPIAQGVGNAISGLRPTPEAQALMARGVPVPPGAALGGNAAVLEDKLTSMPILGGGITNAKIRAFEGFNEATSNEVLAPMGQTVSPGASGQAAVREVKAKIQTQYTDALSRMNFTSDQQFVNDARTAAQQTVNLPPQQQAAFQRIAQDQLGKMNANGTMDADTFKSVQSELGRLSSEYKNDSSADNRQLGAALGQLKNAVMGAAQRSSPPDAVAEYNAADAAWANFVRMRTAASYVGAMNKKGVFTPAQLNSAVKAEDDSIGNISTGNALMQDFATDAQSVLGSKYPDSGTGGRWATIAGLTSLGAGALNPSTSLPSIAALGALGLGRAAYTPTGVRAVNALLFNRPQMLQALAPKAQGLLQLSSPGALSNINRPNIEGK